MTKSQAISKMLLDKMGSIASVNGISLSDSVAVQGAIDFVLGEGTYDRLVSELYDELRAKASS